MPYEVRARPYSETSAACAAAVAFDDAPRVLTPAQFDDEEEEEEDDSRDGGITYINVGAGPVDVTVSPIAGYECTIYGAKLEEGVRETMTIEVYPGAISRVSFLCDPV